MEQTNMELAVYIQQWYEGVPDRCKGYITQQMAFKFPGLPDAFRELNADVVPMLITKMLTDGYSVNIGYIASFAACMDYILFEYADVDHFLENIEFEKQQEKDYLAKQSFQSARHCREIIDNAPAELTARQQTVETWEQLKSKYLNPKYLKQYSGFLLRESIKRYNRTLWNDIMRKG